MISLTTPNAGRIMMYTSGWPKNQKMCWYITGSPPPAALKKLVPKNLSVSSMVTAPASTGITAISRKAVISHDHTNTGIFSRSTPGARRLRMVAMMLIAPMMELMPIRWMAKIEKATLEPPCSDSGGYMVQPPAMEPLGRNRVSSSRVKANGRIQNDQLFMRGSAMSGAPIISGIIQLPRPTKAGITAPKIITSACMVVIWLKNSGCTSCRPGWNSSARMTMAIEPPMMNIASENSRYSVPMSLWLVANTQRARKPCGASWCSPWAASWVAVALAMVLLPRSVLRSALGGHDDGGGLRGARDLFAGGGLGRQPALELGPRHGFDHDRHEAVVLAAELGALAAVGTRHLDVGPGLVDHAGDGVLLPTQHRHPPGVDDVVGGDDEADLGVGGQHQRLVHVEQVGVDAVLLHRPGVAAGTALA